MTNTIAGMKLLSVEEQVELLNRLLPKDWVAHGIGSGEGKLYLEVSEAYSYQMEDGEGELVWETDYHPLDECELPDLVFALLAHLHPHPGGQPVSGQARALTPGEVQELLEWATPGEWKRLGTPTIWSDLDSGRRIAIAENRTTNIATGDLIAAAPALACRVLELEAQNAALAAELARAQAGAQAVREALTFYAAEDSWDRGIGRDWEPQPSLAMQDEGERARMAFALAQASAEGAGAGEVAG